MGDRVAIEHQFAFACDRRAPAEVRRRLEHALTHLIAGQRSDPDPDLDAGFINDALVVATELVTNAINAGCGVGRISWTLDADCLRVDVFDDAAGWPVMREPGPADTHGRGLRIIDALATARGTRAVEGGKQAWAVLALPR